MNIEKIIETLRQVAKEQCPGEPEVADFCEKIIRFERDNTSYTQPRYKEPYRKYLNESIRIDDE